MINEQMTLQLLILVNQINDSKIYSLTSYSDWLVIKKCIGQYFLVKNTLLFWADYSVMSWIHLKHCPALYN